MPEYAHNRHPDESEGFFCRFTFGQFFALLVLEVFTLFFVFYLGARYGRGLLGLDREPAVAAAEVVGEPLAVKPGEAPHVATTADPDVAKMAQDLIAKAETPELKDRIRRMIDEAQRDDKPAQMPEVISVDRRGGEEAAVAPPEAPPQVAQAPQAAGGDEVAQQAAPPEQEMPPPVAQAQALRQAQARPPLEGDVTPAPRQVAAAEAKQPDSQPGFVRVKASEDGRYTVQVGSYQQRTEAQQILERWKGKGYPAHITAAEIPGRGKWYRVRIGGFATRDEAARYLKDLSSHESVDALVVLNEQ